MDDVSRQEIAEALDRLAEQSQWNAEAWQRCHDLVKSHMNDELLGYVYDEVVHYSGVFHAKNIFGLRVRPRRNQLELYRKEFRVSLTLSAYSFQSSRPRENKVITVAGDLSVELEEAPEYPQVFQ